MAKKRGFFDTSFDVVFKAHTSKEAFLRRVGLNYLGRTQKSLDTRVIEGMRAYTPYLTGRLQNSPGRDSLIGSGYIRQNVPYAGYQYYETADTRRYDPTGLRGAHWFKRFVNSHKRELLLLITARAGAPPK